MILILVSAKTEDANKTKIEVNTNCLIIFIVSPLNCFTKLILLLKKIQVGLLIYFKKFFISDLMNKDYIFINLNS